jgi:hypothetical protein
MPVVEDHLAHYGVPGMKWGKRKIAASKERAATIDGARARQAERKAEVRQLTAKRINERTEKGKAHLDRAIADKKFEIENNADARVSKQLKNGEKVMKGVKIAAILGASVVGLGAAASIINAEIDKAEEREWPYPRTLDEQRIVERERAGEKVSLQEKAEVIMDRKNRER